jgi:hypothetical protein
MIIWALFFSVFSGVTLTIQEVLFLYYFLVRKLVPTTAEAMIIGYYHFGWFDDVMGDIIIT